MFRSLWSNFIAPLLRRPSRFQVAALCFRRAEAGLEVLMITSLQTRRWILPKGWPKNGFDAGGVAIEEAWEEAGVQPAGGAPKRVGSYRYDKRLRGGVPVRTDVEVYAIETGTLAETYPEAGRRARRWMTPSEAAELVEEKDLSQLLSTVEPELLAAE